jgi:hypothetical protein
VYPYTSNRCVALETFEQTDSLSSEEGCIGRLLCFEM